MEKMNDTFDAVVNRLCSVPELTPEQTEVRNKKLAEERRRERNSQRWEAWRKLTGPMGSRYADCTIPNFVIDETEPHAAAQRTVSEKLKEYADSIHKRVGDGQGLLLFGPSGTGKDHLLTGLSRVAVANDITIKWVNGSTLYRSMREGMGEDEGELVDKYIYPAILYLSDPIPPVGSLTPFQASTLFAIIDGRYRDKKPTWASLNIANGQEAESRLGSAIADRLRDGAISFNCSWPSYRKGAFV